MKKLLHVVGARPNFMKVAPLVAQLKADTRFCQAIVNTGQHYDHSMAGTFVQELDIPEPLYNLGVGSASHAVQTARVMMAFEEVCLKEKPDLVVVVGDVNSTLAATLVASKLLIPVAHVEAGLRSFDRTMPEEINRIVTDRLSDLLLTPSEDANANLLREGIPAERIHLVGNIMIDSLLRSLPSAGFDRVNTRFQVQPKQYAVVTLHRPSNVDVRETFRSILEALRIVGATFPVIFPVHPRTRSRIQHDAQLMSLAEGLELTEPLGYLDFLALVAHAAVVLTDSGGLQEETTVLGVPCVTLRENTERPITVAQGTNHVAGTETARILGAFRQALARPDWTTPALWDGSTAERIHAVIREFLAE